MHDARVGVVSGEWRGLYPFQSRWHKRPGGRVHFVDEGSGPMTVFVHGNPTWSFYFRGLISTLRATRRCIAADHMGMGLSDKPGDEKYDYSLQSRIEDLASLINSLSPDEPVDLVLHDWGGMIGMGWAAQNPERVRSIAAFNTACFSLPANKRFPPALRILRGPLGLGLRVSKSLRRWVLSTCSARAPLSSAVEDAYLEACDGFGASRAIQRFVQDIPLNESDRSMPLVRSIEARLHMLEKVPMLLPWGMRDWVFDGKFLDQWTRLFPEARVRRFEDCGHFLLEDAPLEMTDLIGGFLAERGVPARSAA